jgi:hypothetical protein
MDPIEPIDGATATLPELRRAGIDALVRALGRVGMARFFQHFGLGHGNYTAERDRILGMPHSRRTDGRVGAALPQPAWKVSLRRPGDVGP